MNSIKPRGSNLPQIELWIMFDIQRVKHSFACSFIFVLKGSIK